MDKLWVGHNYSHVPEETLSNFAYVCLDVTQSVEEVKITFSIMIVLKILFFSAGEQLCLSDRSGCLNGLPHSYVPTLPSSATTEGSHGLVYDSKQLLSNAKLM